MDRRTLHRRLCAESSSFQRLLQEVRDELAARHVRDGSRSLTEVADLMGFASVSALSHWFRKRHGCAPSDWRTRRPDRGGGPPA